MDRTESGAGIEVHDDVIVALVDVLGARTKDVGRAHWIVEQLTHLRSQANTEITGDVKAFEDTLGAPYGRVEIRLLGDTVAFIWHSASGPASERLTVAGLWMQVLFLRALGRRLPMRGAFGYGGLVLNEIAAIGPAMTDAAEWYERAEWLGVIASPRCAGLLEERGVQTSPALVNQFFVRWRVPLKNGRSREMWALAWPRSLLESPRRPRPDYREWLLAAFEECGMSRETRGKYANTIAFFDDYVQRFGHEALEEQ